LENTLYSDKNNLSLRPSLVPPKADKKERKTGEGIKFLRNF